MNDVLAEVTRLRAEYQSALIVARAQAKAEMEARVEELTLDIRQDLARACHAAHASGVTKWDLKTALGVYNDTRRFNLIWNAVEQEIPTDLRRRTPSEPDAPEPVLTLVTPVDDSTLEVQIGDREWMVTGQWIEDEDGRYFEISNPEHLGSDYASVFKAIADYVAGI